MTIIDKDVHRYLARMESQFRIVGRDIDESELERYEEEVLKIKFFGFDVSYHKNSAYVLRNIFGRERE